MFILINNQLLSTANAKDINTDYNFTNIISSKKFGPTELNKMSNQFFLDAFLHAKSEAEQP